MAYQITTQRELRKAKLETALNLIEALGGKTLICGSYAIGDDASHERIAWGPLAHLSRLPVLRARALAKTKTHQRSGGNRPAAYREKEFRL